MRFFFMKIVELGQALLWSVPAAVVLAGVMYLIKTLQHSRKETTPRPTAQTKP